MAPNPQIVQGALPEGIAAFALAEPGKQYAIYVCRTSPAAEAAGRPLRWRSSVQRVELLDTPPRGDV